MTMHDRGRGPTTRATCRANTTGGRRFSIYWTWSYPWEAQRDLAELDNRFSTMTEVRNGSLAGLRDAGVRRSELPPGDRRHLELFHRSTLAFQELAGEATGHPVAVFQRIDQAGYKLPIDERILADTDTLMVFGLDHLLSEQEAAPEEIAAIKQWLQARGHVPAAGAAPRCRLHRRLRSSARWNTSITAIALVPRQQRFGQYTRSLMKALDVPVHNKWGLRPAVVEGTKEIAPLDRLPRSRCGWGCSTT